MIRDAYLKASANNTLPANARQIYYGARPAILALTRRSQRDDHYFTQDLLPDYMHEHPEKAADWDVVYDAQGHLRERHTDREVALGTIEVREYLRDRPAPGLGRPADLPRLWPTAGPRSRFGAVLFIEKEGFDPLLREARLAERFDVAIMSTKGMSVTAARRLLDGWTEQGVKVLVAPSG